MISLLKLVLFLIPAGFLAGISSSASLYIADPFKKGSWTHLFDTHPPIEKRIERLEHM